VKKRAHRRNDCQGCDDTEEIIAAHLHDTERRGKAEPFGWTTIGSDGVDDRADERNRDRAKPASTRGVSETKRMR
jgi:hypothetical protein